MLIRSIACIGSAIVVTSVSMSGQLADSVQSKGVVSKAVSAIGGPAGTERVHTLLIEATRTSVGGSDATKIVYRLMFPDRFQEVSSMTYTIDAERYWQLPVTTAENMASARKAKTRVFTEIALSLLVKAPGLVSVRAEPGAAASNLVFNWDNRSMRMAFDPATGRPGGFAFEGTLVRDGVSQTVTRSVTLTDYRNVDGLMLPFRWEEHIGASAAETVISRYLVNAGVSKADFAQPSR